MATVDPIAAYAVPLVLAVLGITGVVIGASISARSALRSRLLDLNIKDAEEERDFGVRAVSAVSDLGIALQLVIDDISQRSDEMARSAMGSVTVSVPRNEGLFDRVARHTEAWRAVLAESQFYTQGELATALQEFDKQREVVVLAFNRASTPEGLRAAAKACEQLREYHALQVFRLLQADRLKGRARIHQIAHIMRLGRFARQLTTAYAKQLGVAEALATDARAERDRSAAAQGATHATT